MKTAHVHAIIASAALSLGSALFAGCESCPAGTEQVNGSCQRPVPAVPDAAIDPSEGTEADEASKANSATMDPDSPAEGDAKSGGSGADEDEQSEVAPATACAGSAGKAVCDAQGGLWMCGATGEADMLAECESKELCEAGLGTGGCAVCLPGAAKCDGAMLTRCEPDGSAFVLESDCKSSQLCDAVKGTCKASACELDAYMCDGDRLNVCKADLTGYQLSKQCPPGLCDAEKKDCKQCNPGGMACDGNTIMVCDALGQGTEPGATCEGPAPVCDEQRGCVECKATSDCKVTHDCAELTGCNIGRCEFVAKPRRTAVGDGSLVREGNPDPDPIYVSFGGALFYVSSEEEIAQYGGFGSVQIRPLSYARCPVQGTLITERGDPDGYTYVSDGKQLNWVKSPTDLETFCGGSANILTVPAGSLSVTSYPPPAGLCPINKN